MFYEVNHFVKILSDTDIKNFIKEGLIEIEDSSGRLEIGPASIDVRLGDHVYRLKKEVGLIDISSIERNNSVTNISKNYLREIEIENKILEKYFEKEEVEDYVDIRPGEFLNVETTISLKCSKGIFPFVYGRSSLARLFQYVVPINLLDYSWFIQRKLIVPYRNYLNETIRLRRFMKIGQLVFFTDKEKSSNLRSLVKVNNKHPNIVEETVSSYFLLSLEGMVRKYEGEGKEVIDSSTLDSKRGLERLIDSLFVEYSLPKPFKHYDLLLQETEERIEVSERAAAFIKLRDDWQIEFNGFSHITSIKKVKIPPTFYHPSCPLVHPGYEGKLMLERIPIIDCVLEKDEKVPVYPVETLSPSSEPYRGKFRN